MVQKIKNINPFRIMVHSFLTGMFLIQLSCISTTTGAKTANQAGGVETPLKGLSFQSEEYIIYRLQGNETAEMLAEAYLGNINRAWVIEDENKTIPFEKGQRIVIPLKDQNKGGLSLNGYQVVPILCYHRFAEKCMTSLCTSRETFNRQMEYLKANNYRVISLRDLLGFLQYRHGLPEKSVVLTFDDGYRSFYEFAYPILQSYGFTGVLFIYTDFIESSKNALTWGQLKALKDHGFEIGSHGLSHIDFTKKGNGENKETYTARVKNELIRSKKS